MCMDNVNHQLVILNINSLVNKSDIIYSLGYGF